MSIGLMKCVDPRSVAWLRCWGKHRPATLRGPQHGVTPLYAAASRGHAAVVGLLLADPRVDVNRAHKVRGMLT